MGFPIRKSKPQKRSIPKSIQSSIIEDRKNGMTWHKLIAKYEMTCDAIGSVLKPAGLTKTRVQWTDWDLKDKIIKLRRMGKRIKDIANQVGLTRAQVYYVLKQRRRM